MIALSLLVFGLFACTKKPDFLVQYDSYDDANCPKHRSIYSVSQGTNVEQAREKAKSDIARSIQSQIVSVTELSSVNSVSTTLENNTVKQSSIDESTLVQQISERSSFTESQLIKFPQQPYETKTATTMFACLDAQDFEGLLVQRYSVEISSINQYFKSNSELSIEEYNAFVKIINKMKQDVFIFSTFNEWAASRDLVSKYNQIINRLVTYRNDFVRNSRIDLRVDDPQLETILLRYFEENGLPIADSTNQITHIFEVETEHICKQSVVGIVCEIKLLGKVTIGNTILPINTEGHKALKGVDRESEQRSIDKAYHRFDTPEGEDVLDATLSVFLPRSL